MIARYTCEFNITQYGEDSMTDLTQYSEKVKIDLILSTITLSTVQERRESVKDILNLGFTAHLESKVLSSSAFMSSS